MSRRLLACVVALLGAAACGPKQSGGDTSPITAPSDASTPDAGPAGAPDAGPPTTPPPVKDGWTFYSQPQGLSAGIEDVSADEGGNVYAAGRDALYAKRRSDDTFLRFDSANAGLTANCDPAGTTLCPVISVAGAAPGRAAVGFQGIGTDSDNDPEWQIDSGGVDIVEFDGATLRRARHVLIATPPHEICETGLNPCPLWDFTWSHGRRKTRQVYRLAVNHDTGAVQYGDVWMAGTHATFSVLIARAKERGWIDRTAAYPEVADALDVWEHDHPAITDDSGRFLTGETWALALDPLTGDPWASNGLRTTSKAGYGSTPAGFHVGMSPVLDVWEDSGGDALAPASLDAIVSLSFCDDGTMWMGSTLHGLARRDRSGRITFTGLPSHRGNSVSAVACDPSDGSLWVGFGWGGIGRLTSRGWVEQSAFPVMETNPVRNIQIDRWANPRVVYFAHPGDAAKPGGVTAYSGP